MSGNSGDSFSDDSDADAEAEKEEVKEKAAAAAAVEEQEEEEVVVKKRKGPGRPPRKKRGPVPSPVNPMLPVAHKRRSVQPKSGKRLCNETSVALHCYYRTFAAVAQEVRAQQPATGRLPVRSPCSAS